ncbi:Dna-Directed Dna/Rna polymerase Mu [Manis pentadactyla]|nr:Dna-Directed Dna/Rna polymerase Mu [Manis pentadactyla]
MISENCKHLLTRPIRSLSPSRIFQIGNQTLLGSGRTLTIFPPSRYWNNTALLLSALQGNSHEHLPGPDLNAGSSSTIRPPNTPWTTAAVCKLQPYAGRARQDRGTDLARPDQARWEDGQKEGSHGS